MKIKILLVSVFIFTLFIHFEHTANWIGFYYFNSALKTYLHEQTFCLGLAYAIAATFTLYSVMQWWANWKLASAGVAGGLSVMVVLQLLGCWLVGCCGSPPFPLFPGLLCPAFFCLFKPPGFGG